MRQSENINHTGPPKRITFSTRNNKHFKIITMLANNDRRFKCRYKNCIYIFCKICAIIAKTILNNNFGSCDAKIKI